MKPFSVTAPHYDDLMPSGRFDHDGVADYIAGFAAKPPARITDLASGTGKMAAALSRKFPDARIYCEDISAEMLAVLRSKHPTFETRVAPLTRTEMPPADLTTVAFNSINYLAPHQVAVAIRAIRERMRDDSILYLDTLFQEEILRRLAGAESLTREWGNEHVQATVVYTRDRIRYLYRCADGDEDHTQYVMERGDFEAMIAPHFRVIDAKMMDALRAQFVLAPR
jgi:SAM-dependent methyltransferase